MGHREERAISSTECPRCHARPGQPCWHRGKPTWSHLGRPFCHNERRAAWRDATSYERNAPRQVQP